MRTSDEGSRPWGVNCSYFSIRAVLGGTIGAEKQQSSSAFFLLLQRLNMTKPNTEIHKYFMFESGTQMLENGKLTLSDALQYNDPFELLPASKFLPKNELSEAQLAKLMKNSQAKSMIEEWGIKDLLQPLTMGTMGTGLMLGYPFIALIGAGLYMTSQLKDEKQEDISELEGLTIFLKQCRPIIGRTKLCCFSADPDNILMWAHYGQNHEGITVSFRKDAYLWNDEIFKKMTYQDDRLPLPSAHTDIIRYVDDLITHKASCWGYEKEWRLSNSMHRKKCWPSIPRLLQPSGLGYG